MRRALRILNIEDSQIDAFQLQRHLTQEGYDVILERVDTADQMKAALEAKVWDVILSDNAMPTFSAMNALKLLKTTGLDIPFIIISGAIGEDLAVEAMLAGASDYLMKGRLARLAAAIERELTEANNRLKRRRAEEEMNRLSNEVQRQQEKHAQRLQDQQFYTRSLIESNIDALMTTDPAGIITDVNTQMEELTGCVRGELIGAPFKNYFTDTDRAQAGIDRVLKEGKVTNYDLTAFKRDGTKTVVSYNATTFYDRDRTLQGVFASARDVTELKHYEQALKKKNVELEYASRLKSEFLANVSHELRTPLNAIIGFSEVLRDGLAGSLTGQQDGFVDNIFNSGQHLLSLVNNILDLSDVENGKMILRLEQENLTTLFENCLSIVRNEIGTRHIQLDIAADCERILILVDSKKVRQIVCKLLSNALKFNIQGGRVKLSSSRVQRSDVGRFSTSWKGRSLPLADSDFETFLKIGVADSGIGIAPEGLEHLFEQFRQIDGGLARRFEGAGLGLATVKLLTELHGGAVAVESSVGEGSCFTVWLPFRTPKQAELM